MKRIPIGSGCKTRPVNPCETLTYRGSTCAAQRAKHGLGDPLTHADRIRAMSDEELERFIRNIAIHFEPWCDNHCKMDGDEDCNQRLANWLKQPVKGE